MTQTTNPKRRFRFSLRTLLVVVVLLSVGLGWFAFKMRQAERQRKAVEAIIEAGGWVTYDCDLYEDLGYMQRPVSPAPAWLTRLVGDDFFLDVGDVYLSGTKCADEDMEYLKRLTNLNRLNISGTQVTDAGLKHLRRRTLRARGHEVAARIS